MISICSINYVTRETIIIVILCIIFDKGISSWFVYYLVS